VTKPIRVISTGTAVGIAAAVDALQPSLMPTPPIDRGIAAGASWVTAGLTARLIDGTVAGVAHRLGVPPLAARAAAAGVGTAAALGLRARPDESLGRAAGRTAGIVTIGSVAVGAAVAGLRAGAERLPAARVVAPAIALTATGVVVGLGVRSRLARYEADGTPPPEIGSVAKSLGVAAGMAAALSALLAGERAAVGAVAGRSPSTARRLVATTAGHGALLGAVAAAGWYGLRAFIAKVEAGNNGVEEAYADPPKLPTVGAGPGSRVPFETLGRQGRRFLLETTPTARITEVMGEEARAEPIRLYIGYRSAATLEERVEMAVEEIRRTSALERSLLVVASPAGTGYVNYIAAEAAEYMARGDVACISIQYGMRPSLLSADRLTPGGQHHRALLEAIAAERARTGARPRIVLYGESLGAHTSQDAFLHRGTAAFDELGIAGALYVGTPYRSEWKEQVFREQRPDVDRAIFARFDSIADVRALDPGARERLRIFFLDHHNDPVTRFGIDLAAQRPAWLGTVAERPPTVSTTQRWTPLVTFWQTLIDTKNAATVIPGRFDATGHDYRADLAEMVRAAYGFGDVSPEQMAAIEERLRRSEMERAEKLSAG